MTNADIIRTLPIEELAGVIMCPHGGGDAPCIDERSCMDCTLEWLMEERDEP